MRPQQERIKEIFPQTQEWKSPGERAKVPAKACQDDPELRQRVESLSQGHEQAKGFRSQTAKLAEPNFGLEVGRIGFPGSPRSVHPAGCSCDGEQVLAAAEGARLTFATSPPIAGPP